MKSATPKSTAPPSRPLNSLANAGAVQGFAPNDLTTADWMSRRAGQTTLVAANSSENLTPATGQRSESMSWTQISRALYPPT